MRSFAVRLERVVDGPYFLLWQKHATYTAACPRCGESAHALIVLARPISPRLPVVLARVRRTFRGIFREAHPGCRVRQIRGRRRALGLPVPETEARSR